MRTRRQAEGVGACVPVCESAYLLLLLKFRPVVYTPMAIYRYGISGARAARAALELRRAPHFDVGH